MLHMSRLKDSANAGMSRVDLTECNHRSASSCTYAGLFKNEDRSPVRGGAKDSGRLQIASSEAAALRPFLQVLPDVPGSVHMAQCEAHTHGIKLCMHHSHPFLRRCTR